MVVVVALVLVLLLLVLLLRVPQWTSDLDPTQDSARKSNTVINLFGSELGLLYILTEEKPWTVCLGFHAFHVSIFQVIP